MKTVLFFSVKMFFSITAVAVIFFAALFASESLFPVRHTQIAEKFCKLYDVDIHLVMAIIKAESNFDKKAVSHKGASGLMQLTEDTFKFTKEKLGKNKESSDIFDAKENLQSGIWYLSYLSEKFEGNTDNAVSAYNAGANTVLRWLENPEYSKDGKTLCKIPYLETRRYTEKIKKYTKIYRFLYPKLRKGEHFR